MHLSFPETCRSVKSWGKKAQIKLNQIKLTLKVITAWTLPVKTKDRVVLEGLKFNGSGEGQGKDAWRPRCCRCCATLRAPLVCLIAKVSHLKNIGCYFLNVSQNLALHPHIIFLVKSKESHFGGIVSTRLITKGRKQTRCKHLWTELNYSKTSGSISWRQSPPCTSITSGTHAHLKISWLIIL